MSVHSSAARYRVGGHVQYHPCKRATRTGMSAAVGFQEGRPEVRVTVEPFAATLIKPSRDWAREATVGESRLPHVCCKHVTAKVQATVCAHLLEKLQCLLRPCAKFQEPTASPSMSRRPPDPMKERSHDHSENGCLKRYCCNLGRRAGGGGRPAVRTCPEWSGPVRTTTTLQGIGPVFLTGVLPSSRISPSRLPSSSSMQNPCNTQPRCSSSRPYSARAGCHVPQARISRW